MADTASSTDRSADPSGGHPFPQLRRSHWCSLDGPWSFAYDDDETGLERDWPSCGVNERIITVPFPPESERSGIGDERAEPYAAKAHRAKVQHHAADRADEDKRDDDHIARLGQIHAVFDQGLHAHASDDTEKQQHNAADDGSGDRGERGAELTHEG